MLYQNMTDEHKRKTIADLYLKKKISFADIAKKLGTYSNKVLRDAKKFGIDSRTKSEAQSNALETGKHSHPTKGTHRSEETKDKIGKSVMQSWDEIDDKELNKRKRNAKKRWDSLSDDVKKQRLELATKAVRNSSKVGSKLEHYMLKSLVKDGYKVDFHKEQILSNTKLQIDLFLPTMNVAIEIDGPSHFEPVWGEEALAKNKKYDQKKTGLIIGKGLKLIRIKQTRDFSKSRASVLYSKLVNSLEEIQNSSKKSIEIED